LRGDQLGFHEALQQARRWLDAGTCDCCAIGGVDSYLDPRHLEALAGLGFLKTAENPVGMLPGEAACFITVEDATKLRHKRGPAIGHITATHLAKGAANQLRQEAPGEGLGLAVAHLLGQLPDRGASTGLLIANLNGTPYRAQEVGQMFTRALTPLGLGRCPMWIPALSFGEIGAATGPTAIAMIAQAVARNYLPAKDTLVALMNDDDTRGCLAFSTELASPHA
jgi:3-oxoacyl-[acyl-carrier-protein] synthase-1